MTTQKWILGFGVLAALHCHSLSAPAQEPTFLPPGSPAINPIDPAALNDAPTFGDSGPVTKPAELDAKVDASLEKRTTWIPKLQVVLVTFASSQTEVTAHPIPSNISFLPGPDTQGRVVHKTTHLINVPSQKSVTLVCDDVNVEAASGENGELTYSFSCKGKAMLTFHGYTVTGDSISSSEGTLTITNAVIKSEQATMTSESLVLQLPIVGVQVGATNPSDFLNPSPDVIGGAAQKSEPARKESVYFEADKPYDRGPSKVPTAPQ